MAGSDSGAWKILMPRGIVIPHLLASPKRHRLDDSGPAGVGIAPSHSRNQSKDASYLVPVQEAISKGELACSVCHARFPSEGDDVWRPDLRWYAKHSLRGYP
jgi:hypothetical protein